MWLVAFAMAAAIHRHHGKARFGERPEPAGGFPVLHPAGAETMHQHHRGALPQPFKGNGDAIAALANSVMNIFRRPPQPRKAGLSCL